MDAHPSRRGFHFLGNARASMTSSSQIYKTSTSFRLWEAALLILGENPSNWTPEKLTQSPPAGYTALLDAMLTDAATPLNDGDPVESQRKPGTWYTEYALHIEPESRLLERAEIPEPDKQLIQVDRGVIEAWAEHRGLSIVLPTDTGLSGAVTLDLTELPEELRIAIEAWQALSPVKIPGKASKGQIEDWLKSHHSALSDSARGRIATVINWNKTGGAPKTP
ncbi:hypothetical protein ACIKP9_00130 [Methylobacillus methanolivorans]|uniref:Uncharacterized protein n=1 Tax=Methylobacillus methanolivorans TaxID=1848927 RepID=A0ABW8GGX9_9PROT